MVECVKPSGKLPSLRHLLGGAGHVHLTGCHQPQTKSSGRKYFSGSTNNAEFDWLTRTPTPAVNLGLVDNNVEGLEAQAAIGIAL